MGNAQAKAAPSSKRAVRLSEHGDEGDKDSSRSGAEGGGASTGDDDDSAYSLSTPTPSLHENMLHERKDCDPFQYYEIVKMLGEGSMGSVCLVRKRSEAVGGSARSPKEECVRRVGKSGNTGGSDQRCCTDVPIFGFIFRNCARRVVSPSKGDKLCVVSDHAELNLHGDGHKTATSSSKHPVIPTKPGALKQRESSTSTTTSTVMISRIIKKTGKYQMFFALKSLHLDRLEDEALKNELRNEIELLKSLHHPHIVKAIETYEHRPMLFMVLELCSGGDLYCRDPYTEEDAARIIYSILSAVAYLHSKDIIHRDLKYENIMFANTSLKSEVKIIDFGLSKRYGKEEKMHEDVGTIYSMAPQVLMREYDSQADLWSVGVIAFMLLSSNMPFYGKRRRHVIEKILECKYKFKSKRWKKVSSQAKNFVEELLQFDPQNRPTADEALRYMWLNKRFVASVRNPDEDVLNRIQATLETYARYSKLKKLALMVVAHKSTSEEVGILRKVFRQYDIKGDGKITLAEFKQSLSGFGYTDEIAIKTMFEGADLDGTGVISYTEFLAATIEAHGTLDEERLAEAFDRIDEDDSGYITAKNLRSLLGEEVSQSEIDRIIAEADLLHDNRISYDEFLALWDEQEDIRREEVLREIKGQRSLALPKTIGIKEIIDTMPMLSDDLTSEDPDDDDSTDFGAVHFSEKKQFSVHKAAEKNEAVLLLPQ